MQVNFQVRFSGPADFHGMAFGVVIAVRIQATFHDVDRFLATRCRCFGIADDNVAAVWFIIK